MRTLLVTGPGGSGRTTVATATALTAAREGARTLLISADQVDTAEEPGLTVRRLAPGDEFRDDLLALQKKAASALDLLGAGRLEGEELTPLPGSDELALLRALRDAGRDAYDTVVVDLPPLPRALALLALPEQLRRYLRRLLPPSGRPPAPCARCSAASPVSRCPPTGCTRRRPAGMPNSPPRRP